MTEGRPDDEPTPPDEAIGGFVLNVIAFLLLFWLLGAFS